MLDSKQFLNFVFYLKIVGIVIFLQLPFNLLAQSITHDLICSAYSDLQGSDNSSLSMTVGEMITEDFDACVVTNGFLQTYESICSVVSTADMEESRILIYPNPTELRLHIESIPIDVNQILIINQLGQILKTIEVNEPTIVAVDVSTFPQGTFLVKMLGAQKYYAQAFTKISK